MKQRGHSCVLTFQIPEMRVTHSDIFWCWGNTVILSNFLLNFWGSTFQTSGSQDDAELEGFQRCESFNTSPDCCWCLRRLKIFEDPKSAKYRNLCLGRSIAQAFALPRRPQFWSEAEGADWASMLLFVCSEERFSLGQLPLTQRWSSIFLCSIGISIGSEIMRGCWCLFWWCELSSADPDFEGQTCLPKCMFFMAWSMKPNQIPRRAA